MASGSADVVLRTREVSLYNSGMGHFVLGASVEGSARCYLSVPSNSISDVLKTLTAEDVSGDGAIRSIAYESMKDDANGPEIAIRRMETLANLISETQGAEVTVKSGTGSESFEIKGKIMGLQPFVRQLDDSGNVVNGVKIVLMIGEGSVRFFDLSSIGSIHYEEEELQKLMTRFLVDSSNNLKTLNRRITITTRGEGTREVLVGYAIECPVWKASYRVTFSSDKEDMQIQGWAIVENVSDSDWEDVSLRLISGVPVSFRHDLFSARYKRRPTIAASKSAGYKVPILEEVEDEAKEESFTDEDDDAECYAEETEGAFGASNTALMQGRQGFSKKLAKPKSSRSALAAAPAPFGGAHPAFGSAPSEVRDQRFSAGTSRGGGADVRTQMADIGQLFEYEVKEKVSLQKNQSALVPILFSELSGEKVSLYNKANHGLHSFRAIRMENSTECVLESGPVSLFENNHYAGEAMISSITPKKEVLMLPFSMDLRLLISDKRQNRVADITKVRLSQTSVLIHRKRVETTEYSIRNRGDEQIILYIEHGHKEKQGYCQGDIVGGKLSEKTGSYYRVRAEIEATEKNSTVKVEEEREVVERVGFGAEILQQANKWCSSMLITDDLRNKINKLYGLWIKRDVLVQQQHNVERVVAENRKDVESERETLSKLEGTAAAASLQAEVVTRLRRAMDALDAARKKQKEIARMLEENDVERGRIVSSESVN
uniref:DUF4139 domain-containing protein n=2 Tax=Rhodosorus marinus TaxID=101924 RepID=A0A7S2ZK64_9RHOD|mmetsp:Transcript_22493/g.90212  ORF Transcript_22493/g.90212 Transcript_22493/m.90212 type:complete len:716 (+) Transcript_22493:274-2421(+)|eukprot:CAMPEP_0113968744 /NCGR_PEP_ID=MMETSP0011_2-20120614/9747_1 /TAXON_ID=101924 /ORGANISM="Rhodosorus marinus" /LENGTH=715 /DNA_ID=CAMNT_0000981955 /DNA_START=169 /DNA_END=2316 /DNA_ORIENTATION=- /assembly_acc=CAM_ASM_000156